MAAKAGRTTHPAMVGMAVTAFTLLMLMMAPPRFCSTICFAAAWPVRNVPFRLLQGVLLVVGRWNVSAKQRVLASCGCPSAHDKPNSHGNDRIKVFFAHLQEGHRLHNVRIGHRDVQAAKAAHRLGHRRLHLFKVGRERMIDCRRQLGLCCGWPTLVKLHAGAMLSCSV